MCRNIKRLRHADHPPGDQELDDAAGRVLFRSLHVRGQTEAAV
jgi:hypothetical protein